MRRFITLALLLITFKFNIEVEQYSMIKAVKTVKISNLQLNLEGIKEFNKRNGN